MQSYANELAFFLNRDLQKANVILEIPQDGRSVCCMWLDKVLSQPNYLNMRWPDVEVLGYSHMSIYIRIIKA